MIPLRHEPSPQQHPTQCRLIQYVTNTVAGHRAARVHGPIVGGLNSQVTTGASDRRHDGIARLIYRAEDQPAAVSAAADLRRPLRPLVLPHDRTPGTTFGTLVDRLRAILTHGVDPHGQAPRAWRLSTRAHRGCGVTQAASWRRVSASLVIDIWSASMTRSGDAARKRADVGWTLLARIQQTSVFATCGTCCGSIKRIVSARREGARPSDWRRNGSNTRGGSPHP